MPNLSIQNIEDLLIFRKGKTSESYMRALGWHLKFTKNKSYRVSDKGLVPANNGEPSKKIPKDFMPSEIRKPRYAVLRGRWNPDTQNQNSIYDKDANILGENQYFVANLSDLKVDIPVMEASVETLAYYGAVLVEFGDTVQFPDIHAGYPLWVMSLGKDYVQDYLMTPKAGGWYLEWHTDRPHFHMPLSEDSGGAYILAKRVGEDLYHITAFHIPYGKGVYTKAGVIHCDAGLTGHRWLVGYTTSKHYSTVLLRNKDFDYLSLSFD